MSNDASDVALAAERLGDLARRLGAAAGRESSTGASSPSPAGLRAVQVASELSAAAADALRLSVDLARAAGRTWQELGDVLGVSRQAAFQRFGHPIDPRTGEPMSNAILPGAADKATQLMIDWIEERYEQVAADFNAEVAEKLPASGLAAAWAQVIGLVGSYQGIGEPMARQAGDLSIVDIPMKFEASEMKGRVVFDSHGKVAGLFILRPDAL
ncbi:MAG TPA: DUF3887 domain-containing protein [Streptosporangiaceae bacterium]|nr:DUF3887 domain-containing protein [Streptosporangiaceae bacterium]